MARLPRIKRRRQLAAFYALKNAPAIFPRRERKHGIIKRVSVFLPLSLTVFLCPLLDEG
jgi:hypothetical protein